MRGRRGAKDGRSEATTIYHYCTNTNNIPRRFAHRRVRREVVRGAAREERGGDRGGNGEGNVERYTPPDHGRRWDLEGMSRQW